MSCFSIDSETVKLGRIEVLLRQRERHIVKQLHSRDRELLREVGVRAVMLHEIGADAAILDRI